MVAIEYLTLPEEVLLLRAFDAKGMCVRKEADNHSVYLVAGLTELILRDRLGLDPRQNLVANRDQPDDWPERQPLITIERTVRQLCPLSIEEALEVLVHDNVSAADMVAQGLEVKAILELAERRRFGFIKEDYWRLLNPQAIGFLHQRLWDASQRELWPDLRTLATFFFGYNQAHVDPLRRSQLNQTFRRWHQKALELANGTSGRVLREEGRQVVAVMTCLDAMDRWRTRQPGDRGR